MTKAKVFLFKRYFEGLPKASDFELIEEELPPLKDGEYLARAVYFSLDPYQRGLSHMLKLGSPFIGLQVAKIIESRNPNFPVGEYVVGQFGWRTYTIGSNVQESKVFDPYLKIASLVPSLDGQPVSLILGAFGRPGNCAYFGFLEICQPQPGETVVVTGAGGAVGNHVGQIAKMKGCKVIGIAGSDEKGKWLKETLGFDHFINYKTQNVEEELKIAAPTGVDCYFDNVGGEISSVVISQMNRFGRISVCGAISAFNDNHPKATILQPCLVSKQLKMEGFVVRRWDNRWNEGIQQNLNWIKEGKLKYRETITEGFENLPKAFIGMLQGANCGKALVKV